MAATFLSTPPRHRDFTPHQLPRHRQIRLIPLAYCPVLCLLLISGCGDTSSPVSEVRDSTDMLHASISLSDSSTLALTPWSLEAL